MSATRVTPWAGSCPLTDTSPGGTTTTAYTYDGSDRLASVTVNGTTIETDGYDAAGNRTSVKSPVRDDDRDLR